MDDMAEPGSLSRDTWPHVLHQRLVRYPFLDGAHRQTRARRVRQFNVRRRRVKPFPSSVDFLACFINCVTGVRSVSLATWAATMKCRPGFVLRDIG